MVNFFSADGKHLYRSQLFRLIGEEDVSEIHEKMA